MYIKGVGMTKFGFEDSPVFKLVQESSMEALNDADVSMDDIDAVVISNSEVFGMERHTSAIVSSIFQKKMPIINTTAVCCGGGAALWTANKLNYNNVLVIGVEKVLSNNSMNITEDIMTAAERVYEQTEGLNFPAQYALIAQQYMLKYNATNDDLALVAYKNHENAVSNPKARFYNKKVSLEDIKNSPLVASPLRLFDCSLSVNGSAAAVITKNKTDIEISASSLFVDRLAAFERDDMTSSESASLAAAEAYKQAGISADEIDIAEVHDSFTPAELISYEDLGFCKKGQAKEMIRNNMTSLNGKLPVNTSGGLKAKGHPISATGISQIYELVKQMRNEAGKNQIDNIKYALAHNVGGAGSAAAVHILKKW